MRIFKCIKIDSKSEIFSKFARKQKFIHNLTETPDNFRQNKQSAWKNNKKYLKIYEKIDRKKCEEMVNYYELFCVFKEAYGRFRTFISLGLFLLPFFL